MLKKIYYRVRKEHKVESITKKQLFERVLLIDIRLKKTHTQLLPKEMVIPRGNFLKSKYRNYNQ